MTLRALLERESVAFSGQLLWEESLSKHSYYQIGGPAEALAVPKSEADLAWLSARIREGARPFRVVGLGSNLLFPDAGLRELVVKTSKFGLFAEVVAEGVRAGGGLPISMFLRRAVQEGWGGLEFLAGVPGSIGGAACMNAGTHLGEFASAAVSVELFNFETSVSRTVRGGDLRFEYRRNHFIQPAEIVVAATLRYRPESAETVKRTIDETMARRKATQPVELPSCGSVFKNPPPNAHGLKHAWQVVNALGLRGHRVGGAQVSEKHTNFIVNLGGARSADVQALITLIKARAKAELGIELEEEVKVL